ncbi:MAG: single-stranded DNA-binding protein [Pirellulaceae bacterium]|nr:single-stranded DNA-binding protein [Planctomycetales bacterium]
MASFNRVILVGNLTRDIDLKYLQSGTAVTEVGLAVNDRRKTQTGEWVEETTFVDVTLWGRTAEIASEYLSKGSPVLVEGRLKLDTWETDGQKRSKLRVVGERMQMLGARGQSGGGGGGNRGGGQSSSRQFDESEYSYASGGSDASESSNSSSGAPPQDDIPF